MASKRALYKVAATRDNVTSKEKRKPLMQGRLVTKAEVTESEPRRGRPLLEEPLQDNVATVSHSPHPSTVTTPRKHLSGHMKNEEGYTSPRRGTPSLSLQQSPRPVAPSQSLELSDSEIEFGCPVSNRKKSPDVMVVDACRQTRNPNTSEVNVSFGMEHSPARVVCHSAAKVPSDLHGSGSVVQATHVSVDQVPSVLIHSGLEGSEQQTPPKPTKQHSGSRPEFVKSLYSQSGPEDIDSSALAQVMSANAESSLEEMQSICSEDFSHMQPPTTKAKSSAPASAVKKRKKAAQVIASRYMQAATKVATRGPMKATDRSILDRSKAVTGEASLLVPKRTGGSQSSSILAPKRTGSSSSGRKKTQTATPGSAKKKGKQTTPAGSAKNTSVHGIAKKPATPQFSMTPDAPSKGNTASTPTTEASSLGFMGDHAVDVSAITVHSSLMSTPESLDSTHHTHESHSRRTPRGQLHFNASALDSTTSSQTSSAAGRKGTVQKSPEITQQYLELLYSRYLQWVFLNHTAEKNFKEQEKSAMAQMYGLWEESEKMRQRKFDLELQLAKLRHTNQLDDALDLQQSGLNGVVSSLGQLSNQYTSLVEAVDTTRHQIPTRGIHIPEEEDQYLDALQHALGESEQLLKELSVMTHQQNPKVTNHATALNAMAKAVHTEIKELNKCQELLSAAQALTIQESSLRVQDMSFSGRGSQD